MLKTNLFWFIYYETLDAFGPLVPLVICKNVCTWKSSKFEGKIHKDQSVILLPYLQSLAHYNSNSKIRK